MTDDYSATRTIEIAHRLREVCRELNWLSADSECTTAPVGTPAQSSRGRGIPNPGRCECWLRWLLNNVGLLPEPRRLLDQHLRQGLTLVSDHPASRSRSLSGQVTPAGVDHWLGTRLYLLRRRHIESTRGIASVVCSRLGRGHAELPDWPLVVNSVLREIAHHDHRLLLVPQVTLCEALADYAVRAGIATIKLSLPANKMSLTKWVANTLGDPQDGVLSDSDLFISPSANNGVERLAVPLQDRCAMFLADYVYALSIRQGGTIDRLLQERLREQTYRRGRTFVLVQPWPKSRRADKADFSEWLDRGAVGWYLPEDDRRIRLDDMHRYLAVQCSSPQRAKSLARTSVSSRHLRQLAAPISAISGGMHDTDWPLLAHCTRASCGPAVDESEFSYRHRLWLQGREDAQHPMVTLERICRQKLVRGSKKLTRGSVHCVSFSAVPLGKLLSRRVYRSHLSRWDWEPYGILVDRDLMAGLGARPVIYGSDEDFDRLTTEQRAFFQSQGTTHDWTTEMEWRMVGDLDLRRLPRHSVHIFTATRRQALHMAAHHPWSVFWFED